MSGVGNVYGGALYALAREERLSRHILMQLKVLDDCFRQEPEYIRLLSASNLPRSERCRILDEGFRGKIHPYVLSFLKILTEKGYMRHFSACRQAYQGLYNQDNGILIVTAVSAAALSGSQLAALRSKLSRITGRQVELESKTDPAVLGGLRLDFDGRRIDDTAVRRLDTIRRRLHGTADSEKAGRIWN